MYKNVLNQCIIALILLFVSCFSIVTASAQVIDTTNSTIYADVAVKPAQKSHQSPPEAITTAKKSEVLAIVRTTKGLYAYAFGNFYNSSTLTSNK